MTNELSPPASPPTEEVIDLYDELLNNTDLVKVLMLAIAGTYPDTTDLRRAVRVALTINGHLVSFRAVMTHLIASYDQCVREEAERLLAKKAGDISQLLDELSEKVRVKLGENTGGAREPASYQDIADRG